MLVRADNYVPMPNDNLLLLGSAGARFAGDDKDQLVLTYNGVPSCFPFDSYQAYLTRVTSFINGAIYALERSGFRDKEARIKAVQKLHGEMVGELLAFKKATIGHPVVFGPELHNFYKKRLPAASGLKPKQIALAEAFYVWQEVPRKKRVTTYQTTSATGQKIIVEQIDTPRNAKLTDSQKEELLKIHDPSLAPAWFNALATWAQQALKDIVPNQMNGNWDKYQKCRPAILRHIPGEANATKHELIIRDAEKPNAILSHTVSYRQGAPTSFNMSNENEQRQHSATRNLTQMLNEIKDDCAISFKETWDFAPGDNDIKCPILLVGLVTPSEQAGGVNGALTSVGDFLGITGGENNTKLKKEKDEAFRLYTESLVDADKAKFEFFNFNVALNNARKKNLALEDAYINFANQFHKRMHELVSAVVVNNNDDVHAKKLVCLERLAKLTFAIERLEELRIQPEVPGINRNLYLAAMYDVTAQLMGTSSGNCKSSKDRKGVEMIMADAMMIYYTLYKEFPKYNETPENRARLVEIFCQLYVSGHQLLIAHDNSPGCPGIKDEGILDEDIKLRLQQMISPVASSAKSVVVKAAASVSAPPSHEEKGSGVMAPLLHGGSELESKAHTGVVPVIGLKDERGAYLQSRQVAEFNKPGTFWQKYGKQIKIAAAVGSALLFGLTLALALTGVLSPLGILTAYSGAKLGAVCFWTAGGVAVGVAAKKCVGSEKKQKKLNTQTFAAQQERITGSTVASDSSHDSVAPPVQGGSTRMLAQSELHIPPEALVTPAIATIATGPSLSAVVPATGVSSGPLFQPAKPLLLPNDAGSDAHAPLLRRGSEEKS